jgi:Zn finger protein HypA/HybF involved in hydrogenase expression
MDEIKEVLELKKKAILIFKHEIYFILVTTQAYCVKCKSKRDMKNEKQITMKNGRQAISGICTVCGTKMFKIGGGATAKPVARIKAASKKPAKSSAKKPANKAKAKKTKRK